MPQSTILQGSAARDVTTAVNSYDINTGGRIGVRFDIVISAITAGNVTFTVQGKNIATATYYTLVASAAQTGAGTVVLSIHPQMLAAANVTAAAILPSLIRLQATGTGTVVTWTSVVTLTE